MSTDQQASAPSIGLERRRKPSTAANLSFLLAGLGQIYCGALRKGIGHLCVVAALVVVTMVALVLSTDNVVALLITFLVLLLAMTIYSAVDAYRMARRTREDYRLKEYNSVGVYCALVFFFMTSVVGFAFVIRANFLQVFKMVGESMSPALTSGDRIFVRKDAFRSAEPERNDLVAFFNPADRRQTWVKRVIGLPGEEVSIKAGVVHIDGAPLDEGSSIKVDEADLAPVTVPEHHCYLLGDNRANSRDSTNIGPVPMIALVGKVVYSR